MMNMTTVSLMQNMVQNMILYVTNSGISLPEPTALLVMGTFMLAVANLKRRSTRMAGEASNPYREAANNADAKESEKNVPLSLNLDVC